MATTTTTTAVCPASGTSGKKVGAVTLRALVRDEFQGRIAADAVYYYCDAKGCDVVYFTTGGGTITKSQLKVEVGVKEATGDRPLCYCFGHSVASIKEEVRTKGRSDALDVIRRKMKDPGCACEVTNPSGSCCLGPVAKGIETAKAETTPAASSGTKAETISKVGTVLSAVMASACCWLPLVLLAFGVSGAGIAGALDAYRPVFIALTFGFLAAAFYLTYRPRKTASPSEGCCATPNTTSDSRAASASGDCCAAPAPTGKRRFGIRTLNKVVLWGVTVLAVAFLFFPQYMKFFMAGEPAADSPLVRTTTFSVEGMTCEGCSAVVEKAVKDVPGVLSVKADYEGKRAVVTSGPDGPAPTEAVIRALQKAGYRAAVVETDPKTKTVQTGGHPISELRREVAPRRSYPNRTATRARHGGRVSRSRSSARAPCRSTPAPRPRSPSPDDRLVQRHRFTVQRRRLLLDVVSRLAHGVERDEPGDRRAHTRLTAPDVRNPMPRSRADLRADALGMSDLIPGSR